MESFLNPLKRERIRRKTYKTREEARPNIFDYIEFFYNLQRKHVSNGIPWLWSYNNDCPNMGIGGITPAQKLKMAA